MNRLPVEAMIGQSELEAALTSAVEITENGVAVVAVQIGAPKRLSVARANVSSLFGSDLCR